MSASINARASGFSDRLDRARHVRYESYIKSAEGNIDSGGTITFAQG